MFLRERRGRGRRHTAAPFVIVAVALVSVVAPLAGGGGSAASKPPAYGDRAEAKLKDARRHLARTKVSSARAERWLERALDSLDSALAPAAWSPKGRLLPGAVGTEALTDVRSAIRRAHYGDPRELALSTGDDIEDLVAVLDFIVGERIRELTAAGADPDLLWRARADVARAQSRPALNAVPPYLRAWKRLAAL